LEGLLEFLPEAKQYHPGGSSSKNAFGAEAMLEIAPNDAARSLRQIL
jgi:hypothetical protein